ncbi:MAG: hypothetical protein LBU13_05525 [Synergistaceae bacterium]|nr:hypothetical protein [Synergistaceae bacterium]
MQGFLSLSIIIAIVIFLMPFILGIVIFFILAMVLLAKFGLLPGVVRRRYRYRWIKNDAPRAGRRTRKTHKEERVWEENNERRGFHDDIEVITLPETALRKDRHAEPSHWDPFSE